MDAHLKSVAQTCLTGSYEGSSAFPEIVGALMRAGFEGYIVDYRRNTTAYYLPDGDSVVLDNLATDGSVASGFDRDGVQEAVREAQANAPGYSYKSFCDKVKRSGCAGYIVSFSGRRVVYFGRTAETHVEHFPQQ